MNNKIKNKEDFTDENYSLLPFNFERLNNDDTLIVNMVGEYSVVKYSELQDLVAGKLPTDTALYNELKRKSFLSGTEDYYALRCLSAKYRQRKSFLSGGPGLHIFVVTLRCANSCEYCQASRKSIISSQYDMSQETARHAVDRVFESPNQHITIEFQGGEPLLAFDLIKSIVDYTHEKNHFHGKSIVFVIATSLQCITDEMLDFIKINEIQISTSGIQIISATLMDEWREVANC
ncbi:radical SAM protein [Aeromonas veronii]|uniref:radical SAM protein n=1 Tax=Aeromonas veronii TaxID=654 RepID=UPI003CFE6C2D